MASNTNNVKLGVCSVTFDGVDLGYTKGGVDVEVKTETKKVMVDQFGNSEINEYITGRTCSAKVPLAETTLENLVRIMPGAVLVNTGAAKASGTCTFVTAAPVNTDKFTINGIDFTFKTVAIVGTNDIALAGITTVTLAAAALVTAIAASIDPLVSTISATSAAGVVTITADDAGTAGNSITLAKSFVTPANGVVSGATLTGGLNAAKAKVTVPNGIGTSLLSLAKRLVLHPVSNLPANRNDDFTIPLAMTPGEMAFSFKLDEERTFPATFTAYPDPVTKTLFIVGDESAV